MKAKSAPALGGIIEFLTGSLPTLDSSKGTREYTHLLKSKLVRFSVIVAEGISFGRRPCFMNNFTFHISAQLELMRKDYWQPLLQDD